MTKSVSFTEEILNGKLHFLCSGENIRRVLFKERFATKNIKGRPRIPVNVSSQESWKIKFILCEIIAIALKKYDKNEKIARVKISYLFSK